VQDGRAEFGVENGVEKLVVSRDLSSVEWTHADYLGQERSGGHQQTVRVQHVKTSGGLRTVRAVIDDQRLPAHQGTGALMDSSTHSSENTMLSGGFAQVERVV